MIEWPELSGALQWRRSTTPGPATTSEDSEPEVQLEYYQAVQLAAYFTGDTACTEYPLPSVLLVRRRTSLYRWLRSWATSASFRASRVVGSGQSLGATLNCPPFPRTN